MKNYKELLKELGLDNQHLDILNNSQQRYKQYAPKINEQNIKYLDNKSTIATYTPKQIYERVMETGETPNSVIQQIVEKQQNEIEHFEETGVTTMISSAFDEVQKALDIVLPNIPEVLPALQEFNAKSLDENFEDIPEDLLNDFINACEEFLDIFGEYEDMVQGDNDRYEDIYNQGSRFYASLNALNEIYSEVMTYL